MKSQRILLASVLVVATAASTSACMRLKSITGSSEDQSLGRSAKQAEGEVDQGGKQHIERRYFAFRLSENSESDVCFSVDKVPACSEGYRQVRTVVESYKVVCIPDGPLADSLREHISAGGKPELPTIGHEPMILNVAAKCVPDE